MNAPIVLPRPLRSGLEAATRALLTRSATAMPSLCCKQVELDVDVAARSLGVRADLFPVIAVHRQLLI